MSKEDICREDTQIDFKGTFQSNNNLKKFWKNIAWQPKYRRCRFVSFTSDKCSVIAHDVLGPMENNGFPGK